MTINEIINAIDPYYKERSGQLGTLVMAVIGNVGSNLFYRQALPAARRSKHENRGKGGNDEKVHLHDGCLHAHGDIHRVFCIDDARTTKRTI